MDSLEPVWDKPYRKNYALEEIPVDGISPAERARKHGMDIVDLGGGQSLTVVKRPSWGAKNVSKMVGLSTLPFKYVVYGETGTDVCASLYECSRIMREIQEADMVSGLPDISYNAVVGGDGKVYNGRGWYKSPSLPDKLAAKVDGPAMYVGFVGEFSGLSIVVMVLRKLELRDGKNVMVMTQPSWSVLPPVQEPGPPLTHPVSHVRFSYTGGPPCHYSSQCIRAVQETQDTQRAGGHTDIIHNFLIGNDGLVYQGRGWYHQPDLPTHLSSLSHTCLDIAYIGDFSVRTPFPRPHMPTYNLAENDPELNIPGVQRVWWGASAPAWKDSLQLPVSHVRLTHTGTAVCRDAETCCKYLRIMQKFYISEAKLADIPYNFMIGGDGKVYRGRGWFSEPARPPDLKLLINKCLDIAFIGNYQNKDAKPEPHLEELAMKLISYGVLSGKIQHDYTLIKLGEVLRIN